MKIIIESKELNLKKSKELNLRKSKELNSKLNIHEIVNQFE